MSARAARVRSMRPRQARAAGELGPPPVAGDLETDVEPVVGQAAVAALRPFDQGGAVGHRVGKADLVELVGRAQAVEVEMGDGQPAGGIGLHQREGRARHLQAGIVGKRADERAGEGGLAGAEAAGERDHVAGAEDRRHVLGECRASPLHRGAEESERVLPSGGRD